MYDIHPIALLDIIGRGAVMPGSPTTEAGLNVVFTISQVWLEGKNIAGFLSALDDREGIENACRQQLIDKWRFKKTQKLFTSRIIPITRVAVFK